MTISLILLNQRITRGNNAALIQEWGTSTSNVFSTNAGQMKNICMKATFIVYHCRIDVQYDNCMRQYTMVAANEKTNNELKIPDNVY